MLIYSLFALLQGLTKVKVMSIGGLVGTGYCSWAIGHFYGNDKILNFAKAFFAYMLGLITFTASAILIRFLIDFIIKK